MIWGLFAVLLATIILTILILRWFRNQAAELAYFDRIQDCWNRGAEKREPCQLCGWIQKEIVGFNEEAGKSYLVFRCPVCGNEDKKEQVIAGFTSKQGEGEPIPRRLRIYGEDVSRTRPEGDSGAQEAG